MKGRASRVNLRGLFWIPGEKATWDAAVKTAREMLQSADEAAARSAPPRPGSAANSPEDPPEARNLIPVFTGIIGDDAAGQFEQAAESRHDTEPQVSGTRSGSDSLRPYGGGVREAAQIADMRRELHHEDKAIPAHDVYGGGSLPVFARGQDVVPLIEQELRDIRWLLSSVETDGSSVLGDTLRTALARYSDAMESAVYEEALRASSMTNNLAGGEREGHRESQILAMVLRLATSTSRAQRLLEGLNSPDPQSILDRLSEEITSHINEVEAELLPWLRTTISDEYRQQIGDAFTASLHDLGDSSTALTRLAWSREAAEQLLAEAIERGDVTASVRLARLREEAGQRDAAEQLLLEAVSRGSITALVRLARLREEAGQRDAAEQLLLEAVSRGSITALVRLARLREEAGEHDAAEQFLLEAAGRVHQRSAAEDSASTEKPLLHGTTTVKPEDPN
ncbi:hypothetical protein [Kribbella sp. CA-293567]|uniref:hypothetical protein n=1 Tax=Kribbella sp. CA-293567 TaxID=3002436 RepID=UPI0022DDE9A7|nr:hypothetical protein [Kribbella sp. CA-293567]WBQ04444.1 hypothetical protein OX958_31335 [Kribbella sp. CA-293567]